MGGILYHNRAAPAKGNAKKPLDRFNQPMVHFPPSAHTGRTQKKKNEKENEMANMLSVYKRKVSLALKIETIARLDARAKIDGSTRNEVAEYILSSACAKIKLSQKEQQRIVDEIERNKKARRSGK